MIIVAEDNADVRSVIAEGLRTAGYIVTTTDSGTEAIGMLGDAKLIVLDLDLCDSSGEQ